MQQLNLKSLNISEMCKKISIKNREIQRGEGINSLIETIITESKKNNNENAQMDNDKYTETNSNPFVVSNLYKNFNNWINKINNSNKLSLDDSNKNTLYV